LESVLVLELESVLVEELVRPGAQQVVRLAEQRGQQLALVWVSVWVLGQPEVAEEVG
jgi:hypothetical protein